MTREKMLKRSIPTQFQARTDENENPVIEGYFVVFNSNYDMGCGMSESIAPNAFDVSGDIRALINHDTTLVVGRTAAHTLTLKPDDYGIWGRIEINRNDSDAMNMYHRVKRGDVSQCSIGFIITEESTEIRDNGDIHWTITKGELFEVSCCTFPAYEETGIAARSQEKAEIIKRQRDAWRINMMKKLKGEKENA